MDILEQIEAWNNELDSKVRHCMSSVREWRKLMAMNQKNPKTHKALMEEEAKEYHEATRKSQRADALADLLVVCCGYQIDASPDFELREVYWQLETIAVKHGINLINAFNIAHASNMTKLCMSDEEKRLTQIMHEKSGVKVDFVKTGPETYACFCAEDSVRDDGKPIPKGKALKSISFKEPDWASDTSWKM